jgi:hypothetical protein
MEFDFNRATLILFGIGIFGMLFFMIIGAFSNHSPNKKKRLEELKAKEKAILKELYELYIKQVYALNGMLANGVITPLKYDLERQRIYNEMKEQQMDITVVSSIPRSQYVNPNELLEKRMNIATKLNDVHQLSDEEYNNHINDSLDNLNK